MNPETLRVFFGWTTLIHLILFTSTALVSVYGRGFVQRMHARLFDLPAETVNAALYYFLAFYKIVFFVFSLAPWIALTILTK